MTRLVIEVENLEPVIRRVVLEVLAEREREATAAVPGSTAAPVMLPSTPITKADRAAGYRLGCEGWADMNESADMLGVSTRTVERRIEAGVLRAFKTGEAVGDRRSGVRVCRRSVAEYIGRREK